MLVEVLKCIVIARGKGAGGYVATGCVPLLQVMGQRPLRSGNSSGCAGFRFGLLMHQDPK